MTDAAIRTDGLTKHYGSVRALEELDLEVMPGEIFGFLGPNGAGKTTTIRTLLDLIRPTAGKAEILGLDTHRDAVEIRRHIGYLPADLALYSNMTGRELVTFFAALRGGVDWSYVEELAGRLSFDLARKVGEHSTGNRQKMGLIQALMNRPQVMILDEPSTGLDPLVQQEFQKLLRERAAGGATVFLSSHTLSEVERVAHRVGIIRHGHLVVVETIEGLKEKAIRRVRLLFGSPPDPAPFAALPGVRKVEPNGDVLTVSFEGPMKELLRLAAAGDVIDVSTVEADLEEIFLTYYRDATSEVAAG